VSFEVRTFSVSPPRSGTSPPRSTSGHRCEPQALYLRPSHGKSATGGLLSLSHLLSCNSFFFPGLRPHGHGLFSSLPSTVFLSALRPLAANRQLRTSGFSLPFSPCRTLLIPYVPVSRQFPLERPLYWCPSGLASDAADHPSSHTRPFSERTSSPLHAHARR